MGRETDPGDVPPAWVTSGSIEAPGDQLQQILDALPLLLWTARPDGAVDSCNDRWSEYTGLSRAQTVGAGWMAALHPGDLAATEAAITDAFGRGVPYQVEQRLRRHDGQYRWFLVRGTPVHDARGQVVRWGGANLDIHDRKTAEEGLLEGAQRHRSILQSSMDGFWLVDLEGRLLEVNDAYCRMSGYSAQELLGLRIGDLEAVESAEETAARIARIMSFGHDRFETRHRRKDGGFYEVEVSVQQVPGAPRLAVFLRDVTERRRADAERARLEGQLRQAQKMESVGRLAGGIAHDFNNMLGVILGHTALALEQLGPDQPLRGDLEEIQAAAKRSADLTRQLLAFARKQTIRPIILDLNAAVAGMLRLLQRILGEDIGLAWRPDAALWPTMADPSQIDQVLANLCANARDAIRGAGRLTLETGNATFDAAACAARPEASPGDYVRLSVTDTGSGMDGETISHLFEPFFTTKAVGRGTGLGLATSYGIVKQSDGFISVRSTPGHGTTFEVYLPRHLGQPRAAAREAAPGPAPRGHETVLVVEDEPGILQVTRRMLARQGYAVLAAVGPEEALALAGHHQGPIDLLLTDVVMPGMNGPDLAARLQALRPGLRCVFMSGYTANVIAHHGALSEGTHFLQKPFGSQSLATSVRAALERG